MVKLTECMCSWMKVQSCVRLSLFPYLSVRKDVWHKLCLLRFLAELLLWYLTENILGIEVWCRWRADDMQTMCRWLADDTRVRFWVRFHWRMTYVIWNVIRTLAWVAQFHVVLHLVSSACHPQTHMSSTHHPHVIRTSSACHLHTHMS